ncbi:MAG: circadian clock protein KaiC, partial [Cyanobacteria bacterium J06629_9]
WHDKAIREYTISEGGPQIQESFRNLEGIISGSPRRISMNEKSELSRIMKGVRATESD